MSLITFVFKTTHADLRAKMMTVSTAGARFSILSVVRTVVVIFFIAGSTMISANEDVVDPNSKGARATYSLTNTWYRPYLGTKLLGQKNLVPAGFVQVIDDRLQEVAQGFLKEKAWHELTAAEAKTFGGIAQRMSSERRLILLRGVVLNEATGAFEVYEQNEHVLVLHISLGKKPLPMRRKAIVALLQNKPKEVFVSCSMVE